MLNLNVIEPPATRLSASINNAEQTVAGTTKLDDATSMPSNRQTTHGVRSLTQVEKKRPESSSLNLPNTFLLLFSPQNQNEESQAIPPLDKTSPGKVRP